MASTEAELEQQLKETGKQLSRPPDSIDELLPVLDKVEKLLSKVDQSPKKSMLDALKPLMRALIHDNLLKHSDVDVKVAVASCISEITRITAPEAPYDDDQMRDVFQLIVSSFEGLADQSSRSYIKRASILETVSKVRSCVIMLDLECDGLIVEMFEHFLKSVRDYHIDSIFPSMENIMVLVLEESEEVPVEMLKPILASVKKDNTGVLPIARKLGEGVLLKSADKLKPYLKPALVSLGESLDMYTKVVTSVCEGTTATFENNDENTSGIQPADDSKLEKGSVDETHEILQADESKITTASSDLMNQVVKEEVCPEEEVDPTVDKSPKSVMSNGVNVTGNNEETSVDQESKKAEEDISQLPKEDTDESADTDKLAKAKSKTEPSGSSRVEAEKENENENEKNDDVKESVSEKDDDVKESVSEKNDDVKESVNEKDSDVKESGNEDVKESENEDIKESENKAVISPETEKDSDVRVSSPKAIESKKKKQDHQEDESASPSNGEVPPGETVKNTGRTKAAGKKVVIAKEVTVSDTINESEDGEAASDSDAKPLKKSAPKSKSKSKSKSRKQSGKKSKQTGKKVEAKAEESDSDNKPLKMSVKKGQKGKVTVEEEKEKEEEEKEKEEEEEKKEEEEEEKKEEKESDSENKPLKLSAKKGSPKKKDTGKKRGTAKNITEKDQAESISGDDEMDSSPKSVSKSAKGEGNSKDTPVTSAKRKRTTVKDNVSGTIKYDASLIGTKVKVWWPEDKMYYEGVVDEFYPAKKKHKVSYVDGDEETLNLKTQRWEILQEFTERDNKEEQTDESENEEASPATNKKKRSKTDSSPFTSQEKVKDSVKRGTASSSGKSKKENSGAKSASKEAGKSKEDEETPKPGTKTKTVNKSKRKTPPSGSKSNTNGSTKAKSGSSNVKESDDVKTPETEKGNSTETAKGRSKSGNKRKKRS